MNIVQVGYMNLKVNSCQLHQKFKTISVALRIKKSNDKGRVLNDRNRKAKN
jgi:hypothetical protein